MGLFSNKKKKIFSTTVQRMVPDDRIVLSSKAAVTDYMFNSGMNAKTDVFGKTLPNYIIEAAQNAMPARMNKAYRAAKKGRYGTFGLPKAASVSRSTIDVAERVKTVLEAQLGHSINLLYTELGEANYYHFMWKLLIDQYGYNPTSNELVNLSIEKGYPCYLTNAVIHYCQATVDNVLDASYFEQWGVSTESGATTNREKDLTRPLLDYQLDASATEDYVQVTYEYEEIIADTTPPTSFKINDFDGTVLKGVAELGATVEIYDLDHLLLASAETDEVGYCELSLASPVTEAEILIKVVDLAGNASELINVIAPYTDTTDFGVGDMPTQTVFRREEQFSANFIAYIPPVPAEDDDVIAEDEPDYIMAAYTFEHAGIIEIGYLSYIYGSHSNPELEDLFTFSDAAGEFYPRLYARLNADNLGRVAKDNVLRKDSTRLAKIMGIEWQGWVDGVHRSIEEGGGVNINEVKQLFMMSGVPLNTNDPVLCEYLFRYFDKTYSEITTPILTGVSGVADFNIKQGIILSVSDAVYSQHISFSYLGMNRVAGVATSKGKYTSEYVDAASIWGFDLKRSYHAYKFQDRDDSYLEVRVFETVTQHRFDGGSTTQNHRDEALIIPLDRSVIPQLTQNEKEILFAKCMYIFINVLKIIKIKWYTRGAFKVFMFIVIIVITVLFPPVGLMAYGGYAAVIAFAIAVNIAISLVVKLLVKVLVSIGVSSNVIAIIAVIAAIVAMAVGASGAAADLLNVSASTLLQVSNAAFQIASGMQNYELQEIMKQMDTFSKEASTKQELLEKAKDLLETGTVPLSLETLMGDLRSKVMINLGEYPDVFLSRTIGLGNVGTLGFEMVSSYVDSKITLPDLNYTMNLVQRG